MLWPSPHSYEKTINRMEWDIGERVIMNQEEVKKMTSEVFQQLIDKARKEGNTNELSRLFAQAQLAQEEENPDEDEDEDLNESDQYDEV